MIDTKSLIERGEKILKNGGKITTADYAEYIALASPHLLTSQNKFFNDLWSDAGVSDNCYPHQSICERFEIVHGFIKAIDKDGSLVG